MIFPPQIASFLELGYFLDYAPVSVKLPNRIEPHSQKEMGEEALFGEIRNRFLQSVETVFESGRVNVVPLSGGLDSRAVLGGLLEFTEASNIVTYTYGQPGSFDFEIAARVAAKAGVKNVSIPLRDYNYSIEELIETSIAMDHQSLLFFHAPLQRIREQFGEGLHWSGFLGEAITGDHIRGQLAGNMEQGVEKFLAFNRFVKSDDAGLLVNGRDFSLQHLHLPSPQQGFPTFEEGLDLLNRQNKYIAPHVMLKGFDHAAPFNDPEVINIFLSLPEEQKREQALFKHFLQWWQPRLFALPVKNNQGFPLGAPSWKPKLRKKWFGLRKKMGFKSDPNVNYFNFSNKLIESNLFRELVWSQLADFEERGLCENLDLEKLWLAHLQGRADHGKLIQVLFSLEVHIKAGKIL